jgi:hypothetical protein
LLFQLGVLRVLFILCRVSKFKMAVQRMLKRGVGRRRRGGVKLADNRRLFFGLLEVGMFI